MIKSIVLFFFLLINFSLFSQNYCASTGYDTTNIFTLAQLDSVTVKYGQNKDWLGNTEQLYLTLAYPSLVIDPSPKRPFVLYIHGGGFTSGDKSDFYPDATYLSQKGFVTASMNYRIGWDTGGFSPGSCHGDSVSLNEAMYRAVQDAKAALRYIAANAATYRIDTSYMFIAGYSAGAITVLNTAFTSQADFNMLASYLHDSLGSLDSASNNITTKFALKGLISESGGLHDTSQITLQNTIPFLLFHGTADNTIPYVFGHAYSCPAYPTVYGSSSMEQRALHLNKSFELNMQPGGGHNNYYPDSYTQERQGLFLKRVLCNQCLQTIIQDTTIIFNASCGTINEVPALQMAEQPINIFPNPNNGKFTLKWSAADNTTVEIDNVLGQKIISKELKNDTEEFDLSSQQAGIYLIFITSGNQITFGKVILEK